MKILIVGGGGREHAIIKKLSESEKKPELYAIPGNGGISMLARCFPYKATDIENIIGVVKKEKIDLVFVASDDPLALGCVDEIEKLGVRVFGPRKSAAEIEWSKVFSKRLMKKYNIPTAEYETFSEIEPAIEYLKTAEYPLFLKADGLALGKGVICAENFADATNAIKTMMQDKKFGSSCDKIVIEEELVGYEVTVLAFTDGKTIVPMIVSKDHKRVGDGDIGLNTGGMGVIAPVSVYSEEYQKAAYDRIFVPTIKAMANEERKYKGVIYFGLMLTKKGPYVIEYNARFGDPEAQAVLPLLKTDLVDIINACIDEKLSSIEIKWQNKSTACVVIASGGYPEKYETGFEIEGLDKAEKIENLTVFHAGTKYENGRFYTNGGRVLCVTAVADNLEAALETAYNGVDCIKFKNCYHRKDIGRTKNRLL